MNAEPDPRHRELIDWLHERGHSPEEIAKIMARVAAYDEQTLSESIFDSIEKGDFDIAGLIQDALREP